MGFLDYDLEIRKIICSADAIESSHAHYRRAVRARGHFVTEQAALMCLYTCSPDRPDAAGSPDASMTTATMGARLSAGPAARWSTAIEIRKGLNGTTVVNLTSSDANVAALDTNEWGHA